MPADPGLTSISGVILDNQDTPIPGITVRVDGSERQAVSDAQGQFRIEQAPVGPVHLVADGSTATIEGEFPTLAYNIVTVAGVDKPAVRADLHGQARHRRCGTRWSRGCGADVGGLSGLQAGDREGFGDIPRRCPVRVHIGHAGECVEDTDGAAEWDAAAVHRHDTAGRCQV
ncbi:MAG: carboxypeptidase regulatory-like domain-containing protein [Haliea sp.]|nr:carboxypeptidase regulatory-like domain-containing protein [Haliea sp.]